MNEGSRNRGAVNNPSPSGLVKRATRRIMRAVVPAVRVLRLSNGSRFFVTQDMRWAFPEGRYYEKNVEYWLGWMVDWLSETVVYDVGANIGYYSLTLSDRARQIYAFEPSSRTRHWLWLNLRLNRARNVRIFGYALSDTKGRADLNVYSSTGNNSLFVRQVSPKHDLKLLRTEPIRIIDLDRLRREQHLLDPTLIKIDVEGGELQMLNGALETVRKSRPVIMLEYSEATSRDAGYAREELLKPLTPLAYRFLGLASDPNDLRLHELIHGRAAVDIDNVLAIPENRFVEFEKSIGSLRKI